MKSVFSLWRTPSDLAVDVPVLVGGTSTRETPGFKPGGSADATATDNSARSAIDMIETDVLSAMSSLRQDVDAAMSQSLETEGELTAIHEAMEALKDASGKASNDLSALAVVTDQMAQSADQIGRSMGRAREKIEIAALGAENVSQLLVELTDATSEIHGIVATISEVARRTNLLALNATIEAARAGEYGRGFAVVAYEVKALSQQTNASVDDIRGRIARLEKTARDSAEAVALIVGHVRDAHPLLKIVGDAGHEQAQSSVELSHSTAETARFVETVTRKVADVDQGAMSARASGVRTREAINACSIAAMGLSRRFVPVVRQTRLGDRRLHDRYPAELDVTLRHVGSLHVAKTIDISEGGILLALVGDGTSTRNPLGLNARVEVDFGGGCVMPARFVAESPIGLHLAFVDGGQSAITDYRVILETVTASYRPMIERAQEFAAEVILTMEKACHEHRVTKSDLFDIDYQPVPASDPPQFTNRALGMLETLLTPIQERFLSADSKPVFALSIDRNGYIPVHNRQYSQPQRPGDPVWNAANCRNRRIFDDRAGITAARSTRPFIAQAYQRDMGGGRLVMMREVDAPITVQGEHWGGVRMAYSF